MEYLSNKNLTPYIKKLARLYREKGFYGITIKLIEKVSAISRGLKIDDLKDFYTISNKKWVLKKDLNCVLIVVHEATVSGAPILALNIGHLLEKNNNVIYLLLRNGVLNQYFEGSESLVIRPLIDIYDEKMVHELVSRLHKTYPIDCAILNTVETSMMSSQLCLVNIPTVCLIHECASLYPSKYQFESLLLWANISVFSSQFLVNEAINHIRGYEGFKARVLPQGLCRSADSFTNGSNEESTEFCDQKEEIKDFIGDKKAVLAIGSINYRKGVDLFVGCVKEIVKKSTSDRHCFLWVGSAEGEIAYDLYIRDQISRSGLDAHIKFISPKDNLNFLYQSADVLMVTSRLDALPNVAIDAMHFGIPAVIFESTTGLEEYLTQDLKELCVSRYLEIDDMAQKIINILDLSVEKRAQLSINLQKFAKKVFSMDHYIAEINTLLDEAQILGKRESEDYIVINQDKNFRIDFYTCNKDVKSWPNHLIAKNYLRTWAIRMGMRKPFPGFHPGIYSELNTEKSGYGDPYAAYIMAGKPNGEWIHGVINPSSPQYSIVDAVQNTEVALHIHVYYSNQFLDIMNRLEVNIVRPDLFISVPSQEVKDYVSTQLQTYSGNVRKVEIFPNIGRDIAPLINLFGMEMSSKYKYCGHIHTKSSKWLGDGIEGKLWFTFLIENLLGGVGGSMADKILYAMKTDQVVELVFPDDPNVVGWDKNLELAKKLAESVGVSGLPTAFNFPVGTMFWCKSALMKKLLQLNIQMEEFPQEPIPNDGTILHAVERLIPFLMSQPNSRYLLTNVPGVTR